MEINIKISQEFRIFTERFYADIFDDITSENELIDFSVSPFIDPLIRARLGAYLDEMTNDRISGEDLCKLWRSSPADIIFYDGEELRRFLRAVRDRL